MKDLRSYLAEVQAHSSIAFERIDEPVRRDKGLSARVKAAESRGNPVMVFSAADGSSMPVISGLHACRERVALALGVAEADAVEHFLACLRRPVPVAWRDAGPVQEVCLSGAQARLDRLPILTHAPLDSGPYITAGVGVVRDPESGAINTGIYRLQVLGPGHFTVGADIDHDLGRLISDARDRRQNLPFAVILGHHPAFTIASQADVPMSVDSYEIAGALLGEPLQVVKGRTIDLPVPADAEIVIEGIIEPDHQVGDGPFSEFTYHYGTGRASVCRVTAITHRKDAYYVDIHNAHVEHRCLFIFPASEATLLERLRKTVSCRVKSVHIPFSGAGMHANVALVDANDAEAAKALGAALDHEKLLVKHAVAVDQDIDPANPEEILWAIATRYQADRDTILRTRCNALSVDPSARRDGGEAYTTKVGVNACLGKALDRFPRADRDTGSARDRGADLG